MVRDSRESEFASNAEGDFEQGFLPFFDIGNVFSSEHLTQHRAEMEHGDEVEFLSVSKSQEDLSGELKNVQESTHAVESRLVRHPSRDGKLSRRLGTLLLMKGVAPSKSPKLLNLDLITSYVAGLSGPGKCSGELKGN